MATHWTRLPLPGLATAHQALGRLPWAEVLAPAIALAEGGFETDWFGALMQGMYLELLLGFPATARTFLRDGRYPHRPPATGPGDLFRQPKLAATLFELADGGLAAYLDGAAGPALVDEMSEHDGLITTADLTSYQPRSSTPHAVAYRDYTVLGPAHGGLYGLLFAVLNRFDLAEYGPLRAARLHIVAEAIRRCRQIEALHAGDRRPALIHRMRSPTPGWTWWGTRCYSMTGSPMTPPRTWNVGATMWSESRRACAPITSRTQLL